MTGNASNLLIKIEALVKWDSQVIQDRFNVLNLRDKVTFVGPCRGNTKRSEACADTCSRPITRAIASEEFNCQKLLDSFITLAKQL